MNQNFSENELIKLCKKKEWEDYNLTKEELIIKLKEVFVRIIDNSFEFSIKKVNNFYLINELSEKLVLRKLNDNLKRLYKDHQSNRHLIISQVQVLLEETCPIEILKTDIKSFYESIDRIRLIEKIKDDSILSHHSINLINKLFSNPLLSDLTGLPRGVSISSTLSEIYMRNFDKWVRRYSGVYYYARFVDDIIIFAKNKESILNLRKDINANLEKGLIKNEIKTVEFDGNKLTKSKPLEYLGYKFNVLTTKLDGRKIKRVVISIAPKKVKKIKTRIICAFLDYLRNRNSILLTKRIKFLTGNFSVRRNSEGNELRAGIYYNYPLVNDYSVFDELNSFYLKTLFSKNMSFGIKMNSTLNANQKSSLSKFSFKYGFLKKIYHSFKPNDLKKINACWL